jgi:DUF4097 and DUF4098 domain-containing protein YvlB
MKRCAVLAAPIGLLAAVLTLYGCSGGPSVSGNFDRSFTVTGPIRLELSNAAGDVQISGSADGKVNVRASVHSSGMGFDNPQTRLDEFLANPPVEQKGDTIRIGKDMSHVRNLAVSYTIEVPHDTEVTTTVVSGSQTIRSVRGPVKAQAASGSIRVEHIDREAQLISIGGSLDATDVGDDVRGSSASGAVSVNNAKGDVRINALSGVIHVVKPGGRVDAETASGSVDVQGATNDVMARSASGQIAVQGNPASNAYWQLKTASGAVKLSVPSTANFQLSADATSGDIRADVPIVIEEQGKHSLRAHVGNGGARVEVHTVSGNIRISGSN